MAFLEKTDLKLSILEDELDEIVRDDGTIVTQALSSAQAEIKAWLYDSYDVDAIFAATGADRHPVILQHGVDIAVYRIVAACQAGQNLDDRKDRYDVAVAWLKAVQRSKTYADLPRRETTVQTHIVYGSNPKRKNHY